MAAHYDTYDYPAYWKGREYEHASEVYALKGFIAKIPKIDTILEIGAGFGRLTPTYLHRAKTVILSDPSAKLLGIARQKFFGQKNVKFIHSGFENISKKVRRNSCDLVILVRVLHHIKDVDSAFETISKLLKDDGFLILEFANKQHFKAQISEFFKGNFTFPFDIFPKVVKSSHKKRAKALPFLNYHPDIIKSKLEEKGFTVIEERSVSNIRSPFLKKYLTTDLLIAISKLLQSPLAHIDFGPSIFLLAQKKKE